MPFWGGGAREKEEAIPRHLPLPTGPYAVGYQVCDLISPLFPAGRMFGLFTQKGQVLVRFYEKDKRFLNFLENYGIFFYK
jgi:hypothetical protein